jgi:hypothetical protein
MINRPASCGLAPVIFPVGSGGACRKKVVRLSAVGAHTYLVTSFAFGLEFHMSVVRRLRCHQVARLPAPTSGHWALTRTRAHARARAQHSTPSAIPSIKKKKRIEKRQKRFQTRRRDARSRPTFPRALARRQLSWALQGWFFLTL